jgi:hypothetical protein
MPDGTCYRPLNVPRTECSNFNQRKRVLGINPTDETITFDLPVTVRSCARELLLLFEAHTLSLSNREIWQHASYFIAPIIVEKIATNDRSLSTVRRPGMDSIIRLL